MENFPYEMRYQYQRNGNENLLRYTMNNMFAIRPEYKREEVIIRFSAIWRPFEPSKLIQSPSAWSVMYASHVASFDGDYAMWNIVEDEE